jgi:23S rRNA (cytosine1962-C5)-methyltransferase
MDMDHPAVDVLLGDWPEHELLDSGGRRKLERFGPCRLVRPEPKAWWRPTRPAAEWDRADAVYEESGRWRVRSGAAREWTLAYGRLVFQARLADGSKHVGVFPEQAPHWAWIQDRGGRARGRSAPALLNLFGYTGAASLVAAAAGFEVTHVDASRPAVAWARRNQTLSGLEAAPMRWLVEDAVRYVRREARRGRRYDVILLDPPSFGRGPSGQVWKAEDDLAELLGICRDLLSPRPLGVVLTLYNLEASSLMAANLLAEATRGLGGRVCAGELALRPTTGESVLPLSLYARWEGPA